MCEWAVRERAESAWERKRRRERLCQQYSKHRFIFLQRVWYGFESRGVETVNGWTEGMDAVTKGRKLGDWGLCVRSSGGRRIQCFATLTDTWLTVEIRGLSRANQPARWVHLQVHHGPQSQLEKLTVWGRTRRPLWPPSPQVCRVDVTAVCYF